MIRTTFTAILILAVAPLATPLQAQTLTPTEQGYWETTFIKVGLETHTGNADSTALWPMPTGTPS